MSHAIAVKCAINDLKEAIDDALNVANHESFFIIEDDPKTLAAQKQDRVIRFARRLIALADANVIEWNNKFAIAMAEVEEADHPRHSVLR